MFIDPRREMSEGKYLASLALKMWKGKECRETTKYGVKPDSNGRKEEGCVKGRRGAREGAGGRNQRGKLV